MNIKIELPHTDFYNGEWDDVALSAAGREEYVDVNFFPEFVERPTIRTFEKKYITVLKEKVG